MALKKNIFANYLGQGWSAVMGLAFIPMYIRYLGMEAYGLIGLFAVMQAWLALLDMGMSPTLNREMARFTVGAHSPQSIRDLLRSLEIICFSLAALIALGIWAASDYLARDWLIADKLPTAVVAQALSIMAFVVALRFVEGIYRGSLFGLQQQVWYNAANAILATVRHGGAVAVLAWISPTVKVFFLWQAVVSMLSIVVFATGVQRVLPKSPLPPRFSPASLAGVWKFARGMMGITFLAILLTQVDKVLLSRLLSLESFGYYTLAATVAGVLYMVVGPVTAAIYPRMVELSIQQSETALVSVYHHGAQLITTLIAPAAMLLSFFAGGVIFMWSGDTGLAEHVAPILSVMVLGNLLNALLWMPYQCQVAHGWTSLTLKIATVAVIIFIPAIFWVVPRYGAVGAAWIWVTLEAGHVLIAIELMHRRLIPKEKWRWYVEDLLLPISGAGGVILLAQRLQPGNYQSRWHWFAFLFGTGSFALLTSAVLAGRIRAQALTTMARYFYRS